MWLEVSKQQQIRRNVEKLFQKKHTAFTERYQAANERVLTISYLLQQTEQIRLI